MSLAPGEQDTPSGVSPWRLAALLLPMLLVIWVWNTRFPPVREYTLYLTEDRKPAELPWEEVREDWSEAEVSRRFASYPVRCEPDYTGMPQITRVCTVDVKCFNGTPALYVSFMIAGSTLQRVAPMVPWWSHAAGLAALKSAHGVPSASQQTWHAGVRLHGWKLPNGAAVFYNRDRPLNPLQPNSAQWVGPAACRQTSCIQ